MTTDSNVVETIFKTKEGYNECDHCQSVLSPAAYFVKLVETIEKYIEHKLKERRPDLFELPLDCNSTNKTKLYLEIANEIMEKNLDKKLGGNALQKLATAKYPFNLPANFPLVSIRAYLEKQGITLADLYKVLKPEADNVAESLGLSPEEYDLITSTSSEVYSASASELKNAEKFIAQTNIDFDRLELLRGCYNKLAGAEKLTIGNETRSINGKNETFQVIKGLNDQELNFLHRFIRLANKLNWSFAELCNVLLAIDKNEIDANSLKEISRIKSLQEKFKKPLIEVCKLYPSASISIEENTNKKDANNAAESLFFLQGVKESDLKKIYGIEEPSEPFKEENFDEFIVRTGARRQEVEWLLSQSTTHVKKAKKQEKISVKEQKFLHNFTQLAGQLKLLFGKLNTIIAELPSEFKLKDLVTNTDNSTVLQKIWNISDNELTSLVNYNDKVSNKTGKSLILGAHKQILLARLMNISIAEVIQISLQLNINELTIDNVECIIKLNSWLSENFITIGQLNTFINSSALSHQHVKEISEIEKEIEKNQELEIRKRLDSLVSHAELAGEWKIQVEKILEESKIKKLKSREKLDALMNDSTLSVDCKTKMKGILEELKSKEKLDLLINDSTLSEEYKIKEIIEKAENKKLTSKERLDALINDSTLSEKCKTKINEVIEERENLHNEIRKHFNVSSDVLAAAHQFTEKQPTNLQLLRLESLNKNIVHDVGIIGNKAVFLGESKVHSKNSVEFSMREPRKNVAVATIGTKTIFFGGKKSENEYSRKIDIYDEKTKSWVTEAASEERDSAAVAIVGSKAIFLGGNKDNRTCSSQIDVYDNGVWEKHTASEARSNASVAVVGEKAIFFGGKINDARSSAIDIYNNEEWVNHTDTASEARSNASVAIVDTKVIFFGGSKGDNQCSSKVDIYDSKTEKWTTHTVSEARENASVAVVDGKAIFFGGKAGQTRSNKIDIYDAKTEKWIEVQHVASEARDMVQVAVVNKQAIFFGGNKGDQEYSKYIDVYDSATNSWKFTGEISKAHNNVSVAVIGTKAIFFTKEMDNRIAGQVYIYDSTGYSVNNSIAKNWTRRVAKENEMHDGLFAKITNSTKFSGKIDIYDNIAKTWKSVDVYKPSECTSIDIRNNKAILTCKDSSGRTYEETYSIDLSITYDATIEELLNNVAVFTTLKLSAEDVKSIANHSDIYGLKATWVENQIKTLTNYKELQDAFSGNELTLSQYTEWLCDSYDESKVTEKITQLTNWDKKLLSQIKEIDAFKKCFSKENHPIDSLLKIKHFMNMSERSGIDGKILLELKDLHNLPASTGWNKHNSIERKLRELLSYVEGVKEYLEDQKRNILAGYILHTYPGIKNKNMRGLYAFLLIDVEMSDCSKISPLKAGLNSLQLYIHRCILGLEAGATVNPALTEEIWDLLDNYREWEVTKKVALYPENYLNPTLRKSATAEYKALQNTLMQGNLTDEAAVNAYLKYFEDFSQLVNLQTVDTFFADERKEFYILGRTTAEPYTYYYRVGNFKNNTEESSQKWKPWEKIEVQIPVQIARIIHAFGKIFIFWLQKTEKEKQIEDISIDDSTLNINFVFKKVDNSWSAQQKLPSEIKRQYKYEDKIRKHLSMIDSHEQHIKNRGEGASANSYCEGGIKEHRKLIKSQIEELKGVKYYGNLEIISNNEKIFVMSMEEGFENSKFSLSENFDLEEENSDLYRSKKEKNIDTIVESIELSYEKKKKEYKEDIENRVKDLGKRIEEEEKRKRGLENIIKIIEKRTTNELYNKVKDVRKQLDDFQQKKSIKDDLPEKSIDEAVSKDKEKLQEVINYLKERLDKSIEYVKNDTYVFSSKQADLDSLDNLKTKVKSLEDEIPTLQLEKSIEILEEEKNKSAQGRTIEQLESDIETLNNKISEEKKKLSENELEKYNKKLNESKEVDKDIVKKLFAQDKEKSSKESKLESTTEIIKFTSELYRKAYMNGSKAVLISSEQQQKYKLNFYGFYGVYLWEIFFHIPTLVAYLFNQEQKFAEARKWYQYIFNHLKKSCNVWQFVPFKAKCPPSNINDPCDSGNLVDSLDPYQEANAKQISYEKYVIMSYVDNLIDWGDMLFSQNSWEGINEATMLYIRAWDLLGEKPKKKGKFNIMPRNVCEVLTANREMLCKADTMVPSNTNPNIQSTSSSATSSAIEYCSYFCTPENKDFIGLWDRIEDRLYKIRNCLDIKGKRLELPLFQPPIDPRQLISVAASGSTIRLPKIAQVPHYRFKYMITYAKSIADTVTQIGSELLSILEKKDAEALNLLYNKQEAIMANLMTIIKEKTIEALKEEAKALNVSLSSAKDRKSHYEKLINSGLLSLEEKAFDLAKEAIGKRINSSTLRGLAAALHLIPTVFGLACGSFQPGSAAEIAAIVSESEAMRIEGTASEMVTKASYQRREEDWSLQEIMATHDVEQIGYQIEANKINQANAAQDLKAHKESIKQIREKEQFFRSKFTNQELYSWMKGELKSLYIKAYRLALEIARQAERAYQYEIDNDKTFIQPGHWNSLKEGLLSGQKLKFELEQLDKEYHDTNERRLEITKAISLKSLDPIALHELKTQQPSPTR